MAESFNLNSFLNSYTSLNDKKYTAAENGKAAMEKREMEQAEEAVKNSGLLSITLSEKMKELGIGERVLQQVLDTATGMASDVISPFQKWLEENEKVFDERIYHSEIQTYAKQMFFASNALRNEASESSSGQNFVYEM